MAILFDVSINVPWLGVAKDAVANAIIPVPADHWSIIGNQLSSSRITEARAVIDKLKSYVRDNELGGEAGAAIYIVMPIGGGNADIREEASEAAIAVGEIAIGISPEIRARGRGTVVTDVAVGYCVTKLKELCLVC